MLSLKNGVKKCAARERLWRLCWAFSCALSLAFSVAFTPPAQAVTNLEFLGAGPMKKFNPEDLRLFQETLTLALQAPQAGETYRWANPNSRAQGSIVLEKIFEQKGQACRRLKVFNRYKNERNTGKYTLCESQGEWHLSSL